jgi:DNA-binding NarL/FixJ family response regulator
MKTNTQVKPEKHVARVLLVDDHPIVLQGLTQLINQEPDLTVCGQALTAEKALQAIEQLHPDLAIVDICLRGTGGLELIKAIKRRHPNLPVLVVSMHDESLYAERAIRAGAMGYVMKEKATDELLSSIHRVLEGEIYLSKKMSNKLLSQLVGHSISKTGSTVERLSDRELQVFRLMGKGSTTRQIASELSLSMKTVESYREHLKEKLQLKTAAELVRHAFDWVQDEDKA